MTARYSVQLSTDLSKKWKYKIRFISAALLTLILIIDSASAAAVSIPFNPLSYSVQQDISTFTFTAQADVRVEENNPDVNFGTSDYLEVLSAENQNIESYMRFEVNGLSGVVQNATLRVYGTTDETKQGVGLYATDTVWAETGLTWNNRPARTSGAVDHKDSINGNTWTEYNVTSLVTGDGAYAFLLAGDSSDSIQFSSREGSNAPQLVITLSNEDLPTVTPTSLPTFTDTTTPLPETTTPTLTPTVTPGSDVALTFETDADARIDQASPNTNYGKSTYLQVDGNIGAVRTSYIRFTVGGHRGSLQKVILRVFCTTNGTTNGPAVYLANSNWIESSTNGITWNTQSLLASGASDNKRVIETNSWAEYDVTSLITGNGTYTFALVADSTDGVTFSSREGATHPQLLITPGTSGSTSTPTSTPVPSISPAISTSTLVPPTRLPTSTSTPFPSASPSPVPTTSSDSVVLVGAGDISSCNNNNDEATAKLLDAIPGSVFVAGDNVYSSGTYTEYLNCYDPTWGRHKARTNPVPGNHEYATSGAAGYYQYFNNVPTFYAYNLGAWRIYALNSEIDVSASGPQATWLQGDISANPSQCVLAYWHKPRWSSGSTHGNTSSMQSLWQILYNAGAELVISGHEHNYERFAEMDGSGSVVANGMREFVVGTGGVGHYPFGTPLTASQVRNNTSYGVLKLTLHDTGYDWQFVPVAGATFTDSGSSNCH